jgi:hypothetical protein
LPAALDRVPAELASPCTAIGLSASPSAERQFKIVRIPTQFAGDVMPDGVARSATLERMSAVSLTGVMRGHNACADHSVFTQVN